MKLQVTLLTTDATVPTYAHEGDAGMDLFSVESLDVAPGERVQVSTGIAVAIPSGYVGLIWDKSGISHKGGLKTLGGVIDASYRGEIKVGLVNLGQEVYHVEKGAKIAQMLMQAVSQVEIEIVEALDDTVRGKNGFGSTGI